MMKQQVPELPRSTPIPEVQELEREIALDPDSTAPYAVYGDFLIERGDVLGELISHAIARNQDLTAWHSQNNQRLFGPLFRHLPRLDLAWQFGLIRGAGLRHAGTPNFGITEGNLLGALVSWPVGRLCRRLVFPAHAFSDCVLSIAEHPPPALRAITIESGSITTNLPLSHLNALSSNLRELILIEDQVDFDGVMLPNLETLGVSAKLPKIDPKCVPSMKRLVLHNNNTSVQSIAELARHSNLESLVFVGAPPDPATFIHAIAKSTKVRRFEMTGTDRDIKELARNMPEGVELVRYSSASRLSSPGVSSS